MAYFISTSTAPAKLKLFARIQVFDPNNVNIRTLDFDTTEAGVPKKAVLDFNREGQYTIILKNTNDYSMVIDLLLGLKKCHVVK